MQNQALRRRPSELALAATVALGSSLVMGLTFAYRTDYLGHFIAGYGGTLGLLTFGRLASSWRWMPLLLTLVAIAIGIGTEMSIFRLAIFDSIDFFNQSLGAALACCVALRPQLPGVMPIAINLSICFVCLAAGLVLAFA